MMIAADPSPPFPPERAERYVRDGLWSGETLGDALRAAAATHRDRTALVTADARYSYRELDDATERFAAGVLAATPLEPGDRVMFQMGNVAETVVAYYGAIKAGLVPVCTLPQHGEREIEQLATHVEARGHIVQGDLRSGALVESAQRLTTAIEGLDTVIVARDAAPTGTHGFETLVEAGTGANAHALLPTIDPAGLVAFQLSGGTTGLPKVAPRRHHEYLYNARAWAQALELTPDDVVLHPLPIMHNAGTSAALQPAHLSGATCIVAPGAEAGAVLDLVARERVTTIPVVPPAVAIRLLDQLEIRPADLSSLRRFYVGGQKPTVELMVRLETALGIPAQQMFGMAEGMFLLTPPDADPWVRLHTVGTPISPADEVRVLDVVDEVEVPDGELGELACRGPYTINGYHRAERHNATAFTSDGFYRTGDLVTRHVVDGRPYYSIDGRIKDVINRGAEKIHADELEEVLVTHPGVRNAAVVAMPDEVLGERVCAYLVPTPGAGLLTVETVAQFLLGSGVAKFKLPERIEVVPTFPLTTIGKVSKKDLRADIERKLEDEKVLA